MLPKWRLAIAEGKETVESLMGKIESKGRMTDQQRAEIEALRPEGT